MSEPTDWTVPPPPDGLVDRITAAATAPVAMVAREAISPPARGLRTAATIFGSSMGGAAIASAFWAWVYFTEPRVAVMPAPVPAPVPVLQMMPMDHAAEVTPVHDTMVVSPTAPAGDVDLAIFRAATAACVRKDHDTAMRYLFALTGDRRAMAIEICKRNGVAVE